MAETLSSAAPPRVPSWREVVSRRHFPALDGLRAVAVFTVIVYHFGYPIRSVPGDLGVSAFFVLSGFLITRLLMQELSSSGDVSLSRFYMRRTLRIFPAYYVFIALNFILDERHGFSWSTALRANALTYTVNYYNALHHHPSISISHAWSLGVEEQFYLLWPTMFLLLSRRGLRAIAWGAGIAAVGALCLRSWLLMRGADNAYLYNAFETRFDNLAVGCILALIADSDRVGRVAQRLAARSWFPLITLALLIASRKATVSGYHYSLGFTVDAILVAVLIVQLMQLTATRAWSWLEHPVTRYLGVISYPLYLYHPLGASVGRRVPVTNPHVASLISIGAAILLASGSYYVIERPFLKLKRRFEPERSPRPRQQAGGLAATTATTATTEF